MGTQDEMVNWKEEYENCSDKLKQLEVLSKDGRLPFYSPVKHFCHKIVNFFPYLSV